MSLLLDTGAAAAAITAVLVLFGVISRWSPVAQRIQAWRDAQEQRRQDAHAAVVTAVISTTVTPRLDTLTQTVGQLDRRVGDLDVRLTAHMADELARFGDVSDRLADHIEHHPGPTEDD